MKERISHELKADVAIAEVGMSGTSAAVAAAEGGARIVTLERARVVGRLARLLRGLVWTVDEPPAFRAVDPDADHERLATIGTTRPDSVKWIGQYGLKLGARLHGLDGMGAGYRVAPSMSEASTALCSSMQQLGVRLQTGFSIDGVERASPADRPWTITGPSSSEGKG